MSHWKVVIRCHNAHSSHKALLLFCTADKLTRHLIILNHGRFLDLEIEFCVSFSRLEIFVEKKSIMIDTRQQFRARLVCYTINPSVPEMLTYKVCLRRWVPLSAMAPPKIRHSPTLLPMASADSWANLSPETIWTPPSARQLIKNIPPQPLQQ